MIFIAAFTSQVFSQGNYYDLISTSSPVFISDLQDRIRNPYTRISYDNYDETNIANFASIDNGNGTKSVFCVYSGYEYIYSGVFTWAVMSREHTWAHSWMPTFPHTSNDQYSDQYNLFPTHQNNANNRRSNHPFGVVVNVTYQFLEGKVGTNSAGKIVYEPRDSDKGDAARALLYDCVRYDGTSGNSWTFNWLNDTLLPSLNEGPQSLAVLFSWNNQDPPDKWEVDRNNYVQSIQSNRNPFVDHPEYVNYINFNDLSKLNPVYSAEPSGYVTNLSSNVNGTDISLSWNDATGAQLPSGYLLIAYNRNDYFIPIDGSVYANDSNLTDGYAVINISYADANTYSFSNLIQNTNYYFTVYSYNGSGSQINYKTNGTFPRTNSAIPPVLAAEPSNYVANFSLSGITTNTMQLNWNDASGGQLPSGYLLVANNNNSFVLPSDGVTYPDDINLADGSAAVNISFNSPDQYTFGSLLSNTNYYFRIYSYNGTGSQINYKTDGTVPYASGTTSNGSQSFSTILLDNFDRPNNNVPGNTLQPSDLQWQEFETVSPTSIIVSSNRLKNASTVAGREFTYVNTASLNGYPVQLNSSGSDLVWAVNLKQSRTDPSGFDNNNYGIAFILGKTTSDVTTGNGYAVVLGQSGSTDAIRLARFSGGVNANSRFTNIISSGDYANQYLSIKVTYTPAGNNWSLFVETGASDFPQTDPRNTATQMGTFTDSSYASASLPYLGTLWNHATGASDSAVFDDIYVPSGSSTVMNLTAIIEGYFGSVSRLRKSDTVRAYLRNSVAPYPVIDSAKSIIDSLTFTGSFDFANTTSGNYYISVKHRNSIGTWSKLPQSIVSGATFSYDFTNSITKAYGNNLIFKNGKYCIYSGDVNQDGNVDGIDIGLIDNDLFNFVSGYIASDLSGDDLVDAVDLSIVDNNAFNFVSRITP